MLSFSSKITEWYHRNKRALPWRETKNPYHIWLSEIILQQTRVDQGMAYYQKFLNHYPTVFDLAAATEEMILKDWQGLGYYSRARNLHHTAQTVVSSLNGKFPEEYEALLKLKGIGKYTAAAISSICHDRPHAVIDGNVYRVLSRVFGMDAPIDLPQGQKSFEILANSLLDPQHPGEYNQAIMEFGALHCKPQNPGCEDCIFADECVALREQSVSSLPVKAKKTRQRERYFNYLVIKSKGYTYLKKRTANDIWKNMYDFPLIEKESHLPENEIAESEEWKNLFRSSNVIVHRISQPKIHQLSHQKITATFWEIDSPQINIPDNQEIIKVKESDLHYYPVPKLIENYLEE